jgi:hypothetical protein
LANIRSKDIAQLSEWNEKELRKLRITINNRVSRLNAGGKTKPLPDGHPLQGFDLDQCKEKLEEVLKAERVLKKG